MKKIVVFFLVAFMAVSVNAQSGVDLSSFVGKDGSFASMHPTDSFSVVYQKALKLNANRFTNLNKIQIGDTVLFPAHSGIGTEAWIANTPENGVNDCIWRLTHKYLKGQLETTPVPAPEKIVPVKAENEESYIILRWSRLFFALLFLLLIGLLFYYLMLRPARINAINSINANPVLPGGLSNNALRATQQINGITAGLQIVKVERGRIFGTADSKVSMQFSDKVREVDLISGDNAYRVTQFDGSISYYRQHCGNLIAPVASGQFNLPDDWVFVPYTDEQSTWSAPETTQTENEKAKPEIEELPLEVFVNVIEYVALTGKEIATILEAAGKMVKVPSSISVGDLTVKFYKNEKEE